MYGKVGALVSVYDGYSGQSLSEMRRRMYLLDRLDLPQRQNVRFRCRDVLSRAELEKAQVPKGSPGVLVADVTDSALTFDTEGHTLADYPASGTVRVEEETITYSGIVDNGDDTYTWTLVARGTDGTTAAAHTLGDTVQECKRYTLAKIDEIFTDLLGNEAGIEYQYLPIADWSLEREKYLNAYDLTSLITTPTSVTQLLGEICEQCSLFMWWDERDQVIKMGAIHALDKVPVNLTDVDSFIADSVSFRELPKERITQVWVYYTQRDPTEDLSDPQNFKHISITADLVAESDELYGQKAIRSIYSRWLPTAAEALQTASRLATRYVDIPLEMTFDVDAKDRALWVGDVITINNFRIRDAHGTVDTSRYYMITSAKEVVPGERMRYTAVDATLSGFIALISGNSQPDYNPAGGNGTFAFISDNDGLMSDGKPGAHIS